MSNKGRVTLKVIADATGLSVNTVSKVLNKKPYYTKEVEKKVMDAVKKLGYIPNTLASSLRLGSSNTVGIIFDDLINPYYSMMTLTMAQQLSQAKYDVMIFSNYGTSSLLDRILLAKVLSRKVDAVISFLQPDSECIDIINQLSLNFLLIGRSDKKHCITSIYSDDFKGGYLATEHLIQKGHQKILYIGADPCISSDNLRFEGYKHALEMHNIPFNPDYIAYFQDYKSVESLTNKFIIKRDARAIFCFNDIFSFGIIEKLEGLGYRLPQDYALVGYDNIQQYLALPHSITTVGTNHQEMAVLAAKVILRRIKSGGCESPPGNPHSVYIVQGKTT